jgi:hypothetical protein
MLQILQVRVGEEFGTEKNRPCFNWHWGISRI